MNFDVRPGAYAVVIAEDQILLSLWSGKTHPVWTLPGGGIEWEEQPAEACVREVFEESGYRVRLEELLGTTTSSIPVEARVRVSERGLMIMRVIYRATVVSGELTVEVGGSSIDAGWFPIADVLADERVGGHPVSSTILNGLELAGYTRPAAASQGEWQ